MTDKSYPPPCRDYLQPLYLSVTLYACAQRDLPYSTLVPGEVALSQVSCIEKYTGIFIAQSYVFSNWCKCVDIYSAMEKVVVSVLIFRFWGLKLETLTFDLMKMFNFKCTKMCWQEAFRLFRMAWLLHGDRISIRTEEQRSQNTGNLFQHHQYAISQIRRICSYLHLVRPRKKNMCVYGPPTDPNFWPRP